MTTAPWEPDWANSGWTPFGCKIAPLAFPIMIQRAREGRPITYEDLAAEIERRYKIPQQFRKSAYGAPWDWSATSWKGSARFGAYSCPL